MTFYHEDFSCISCLIEQDTAKKKTEFKLLIENIHKSFIHCYSEMKVNFSIVIHVINYRFSESCM